MNMYEEYAKKSEIAIKIKSIKANIVQNLDTI